MRVSQAYLGARGSSMNCRDWLLQYSRHRATRLSADAGEGKAYDLKPLSLSPRTWDKRAKSTSSVECRSSGQAAIESVWAGKSQGLLDCEQLAICCF